MPAPAARIAEGERMRDLVMAALDAALASGAD